MLYVHVVLNDVIFKQLLDKVLWISRIIKFDVKGYQPKPNYRDLDYSGYHKNRI